MIKTLSPSHTTPQIGSPAAARAGPRDRRTAELEAQLREREATIAVLEEQLQGQNKTIAALEEQLQGQNKEAVALEKQLQEQNKGIAALQKQVRQLNEQIAGVKRAGKRQATPFARKQGVEDPKRPGRKKGQGEFSHRPKPEPEEVNVTALLRDALKLKTEKPIPSPETFKERAAALEQQLDKLIHERRRFTGPDNARFAKRLRKHRKHLLRFLYADELDATNNQAERMLRPAVITGKTTGCNRTDEGAEAHAILASILATAHQRSISILDFLFELQRASINPPSLGPPQPAPT